MRKPGAVLVFVAVAVSCMAFAQGFDYQAMQDAQKVSEYLKCDFKTRFEGGALNGGTAVYNMDRDLAFWVKGETIYAVNERAKAAAPELPQPPADITYAAVYDASATDDLSREVRPGEIAMKGFDMSAADAAKLEEAVRANPADLWARTVLLGYYGRQRYTSAPVRNTFEQHVLWLVKNVPEAAVVGSTEVNLDAISNPAVYPEAAKLMKEHVSKDPKNLRLLANAAQFFLISDQSYAEDCLRKCVEIEPNNPRWHEKLGFLHSLGSRRAGLLGLMGMANSGPAKEALAEQERALELTTDPSRKTTMMDSMAETAFAAGDIEKARKYASALLESANKGENWDLGNCIHTGNTILGRIALKEGDIAKAKQCLVAAGKCGGSPQLDSFGPDMTLASELLARGERETVIQYLELCGRFWKKDATDKWIGEIKNGQTPQLNTMFVGLPGGGGPLAVQPTAIGRFSMPDDWDKPFVTLALPNKALEVLDTLFGAPLLVVLGLVILASLLSSRQHLWILAPLAFVYSASLALSLCMPMLPLNLFGLGGNRLQQLISAYFGGLALLWLLSDVLAGMKVWMRVPAAMVILSAAGLLGTINYPHRYHMVAEIVTFVTVVTASFVLARVCCPGRWSRSRFLSMLLMFNVTLMLITWPALWIAMMLGIFHMPPVELIMRVPQCLLVALLNGVGLFVFQVPFLLLAVYVPLYREHFRKVFGLEPQ